MKVINETAQDVERMAESNNKACQLRVFAVGLINSTNEAHRLLDLLEDALCLSLGENTVLTIKYKYEMKVPTHNQADGYTIIQSPTHLVKWKLNFFDKHDNLKLSEHFNGEEGHYTVDTGVFDEPHNDYWEWYHDYLIKRNEAINQFHNR